MYTYIRINQLWNYNQLHHATETTVLALAPLGYATEMQSFLLCHLTQGGKASISTALSHVAIVGGFTKNFQCKYALKY